MDFLLYILIGGIAFIFIAYLVWKNIGDAIIEFNIDSHTPFILAEKDEHHAVFTTEFDVLNTGKQCATIMDCFIRQQLPFEQFDKVTVRGKVELLGAPRKDDYFEAVLIQKGDKITLKAFIEIIANDDKPLNEAVKDIVDIPVDVIYQHTGRHIVTLSKRRLILPESKIKALLQMNE